MPSHVGGDDLGRAYLEEDSSKVILIVFTVVLKLSRLKRTMQGRLLKKPAIYGYNFPIYHRQYQ